jgi:hypothetical protein
VRFSYVSTRTSIGRFVWYGMAIVWVFALVVVFVRQIPFGLVFGPLFLLYGASGLVFRKDDVDGPLPWSEWLAPVVAVGFLVVGTILAAASLALVS